MTGNRVARDRLTNAVIWQYETDTGDWYDAGSEQNARDEAAYLGNGTVRTVPVKAESEVLLAENAALRGKLAAVEAVSDQLWEWKDGIELAGELRAALASEEGEDDD